VKNVRAVWMALGAWLILAAPAAAGDKELSQADHLTLLEEAGDEAVSHVLDQLAFRPGQKIYLVPEAAHPANWFLGRSLARTLRERGCEVVEPGLSGVTIEVPPLSDQSLTPAVEATAAEPPEEEEGEEEEIQPLDDEDADEEGEADEAEETDEDEIDAQDEEDEADAEEAEPPRPRRRRRPGAARQAESGPAPATPAPTPATPAAGFTMPMPADGEVLAYRVMECGVSYPWSRRSWLLGPRRYGRMASVRLRAAHLREPGDEVLEVARGDCVRIDEFPGWARPYLEGQSFPFPITSPPEKSLNRFVEPVLVTAIITGLIYLFNENQK